jgi:hypothetical protein
VKRSGARGLLGAACLLGACLGLPALQAVPAAAASRVSAPGRHPVRLLIVGDSIALTLGMGLSVDSGSRYGVTVSDHATLGCDLDPGLQVLVAGSPGPATPGCDLWRGLWPLLVAHERPQVVALGLGRWEVTDHLLGNQWVHVGEPAWDQHLTGDLRSAVALFHSFGARVVLFTMPYIDPTDRQPDGLPWSEDTPARVRAYNELLRQVARADPHVVTVIDLNRILSPQGVYTASLHGVAVRSSDGVHISALGGEFVQRQILPLIDRIGTEDETAARAGA